MRCYRIRPFAKTGTPTYMNSRRHNHASLPLAVISLYSIPRVWRSSHPPCGRKTAANTGLKQMEVGMAIIKPP